MRRLYAAVAGFLFLAGSAAALGADVQPNGQAIAERLIGKQLFLRGFWADDNLKFDAQGQIQTSADTVPFTESGIDVRSVRVNGNSLMIEGQRMALEFLPNDEIRRVPAKTEQDAGAISMEIAGDGSGNFDRALDVVFAKDLATLAPSLPQYWQAYAMQHFLPVSSAPKFQKESFVTESATSVTFTPEEKSAMHVGGEVKPPTLVRTYNPTFTDLANAQKFTGNVKLYLWFDSDGKVSHVSVAQPAGLGLDEAAIAAVQQYQFQPATLNGNAVTVDLYLNVQFKSLQSTLW
ncbi:MAG TPA: energy transducer TonB [Acidobacteriaceae bacterium]|nr:energy transducer TonB [Acidobacteriaceae bacterium]